MKLSILNKKNNHKPNLQYANQGVILLLLVARADDQWRMCGGCLLLPFRPLFVPSKNNIPFTFSKKKTRNLSFASQK